MGTTCKSWAAKMDDPILQGDIFKDISYIYKTHEESEYVDITEFEFPYSIVLSQSCDISAMSKMINSGGKTLKFMPSVLVAPIYDKDTLKSGEFLTEVIKAVPFEMQKESLFNSGAFNVIKNDDHLRFHVLSLDNPGLIQFDTPMIDFKHYFTVSPEYLQSIRNKRICHLEQLFCEQITLRFSNYLSRVAIPSEEDMMDNNT